MLGILGQQLVVNGANVHTLAITFVLILHFFMNDIKCHKMLLCLCFKGVNAIVKRHE